MKKKPIKDTYGFLTVVHPVTNTRQVTLACVCGKIVIRRVHGLSDGSSCGCKFAQTRYKKENPIHKLPEYGIWCGMRKRCKSHANYAGRGISVCLRWLKECEGGVGFLAFLADMGPRPSPSHSIERVDNHGPYSPENCIWATPDVQNLNKRSNHLVTYKGITAPIAEICKAIGVNAKNVRQRINKLGWSAEKAIEQETMSRGAAQKKVSDEMALDIITYRNETGLPYSQIGAVFGISHSQAHRICSGTRTGK